LAHAYTPGLRVSKQTEVRKERRLPLNGEVLVKVGDRVTAETVVAHTQLPGNVQTINVANKLSLLPEDIHGHMIHKVGDWVEEGDIIAESKSFFGLFKSQCRMPVGGTIESVSNGDIVEVYENEGVLVKCRATFVQGIFGIGGEAVGELDTAVATPDEVLTADRLNASHKGKILVVGSLVTIEVLNRAREIGVKALIAGGIGDADLRTILGYDLGVAITGSEEIGLTVVVTEGFGQMTMAKRTFDLLTARKGMKTSISGATQIRAGVIRPEVVIPLGGPGQSLDEKAGGETPSSGLVVGIAVRAIREPYFGRIGKVESLPPELQKLETEAKVRVLTVEFESGETAVIPRANVELIEE
jgi:hypothetical protein